MKTFAIVVGLVIDGDRVLMLRRSRHRRHAAGKWEPVCGFFGEHEAAEAAVVREVLEETGLRTEIVRSGCAIELVDDGARWIIKPFLLRRRSDSSVVLEREHQDFTWATVDEILRMDCVGGMEDDFEALGLLERPPLETAA